METCGLAMQDAESLNDLKVVWKFICLKFKNLLLKFKNLFLKRSKSSPKAVDSPVVPESTPEAPKPIPEPLPISEESKDTPKDSGDSDEPSFDLLRIWFSDKGTPKFINPSFPVQADFPFNGKTNAHSFRNLNELLTFVAACYYKKYKLPDLEATKKDGEVLASFGSPYFVSLTANYPKIMTKEKFAKLDQAFEEQEYLRRFNEFSLGAGR